MIGRMSRGRHAVVATAIGGTSLLGGLGVIGGGSVDEHYDTWQTIVQPVGADGLRISETFDQDFGTNDRRGHETFIAHDAGIPTGITASSPSAPDDLSVVELVNETRVRIGDPDVTISGQHRYELSYTLPAANIIDGVLSLDVLDPDDTQIDIYEVVLTGMELDDPRCFVGEFDSTIECEFVERDGVYVARVEPLDAGGGLTVEADIVAFSDTAAVAGLPLPEPRSTPNRGLIALGLGGLGAAGALPIYRWARRKGANEVYAGGAADAAYGEMPAPRLDGTVDPPPPVTLVPDDEMGELATIEFVPPPGVDPWEASVLLNERVNTSTADAWLSGLIGTGAVEIDELESSFSIRTGPHRDQLDATDEALLSAILSISDPYTFGKYNKRFATAWTAVLRYQRERIDSSGWWRRMPPGGRISLDFGSAGFVRALMFGLFFLIWSGSAVSAFIGGFRSWPVAFAVGLLFPAVVAYFVYRALLPSRSAQGSALALRTESFRRFLHASEGKHVEWAWSKGILREYSAWAVALGEADAWSDALDAANVPAPARAAAGPIIVHRRRTSIQTTRTAPSSSGGGRGRSGGGFRSGRVGGGGGGRSRGSW